MAYGQERRSLFNFLLDLDDVARLLHLVLEEKLALDLRVSRLVWCCSSRLLFPDLALQLTEHVLRSASRPR